MTVKRPLDPGILAKHDLSDAAVVAHALPIVTNKLALRVNQEWAGHPGRLIRNSTTTFTAGVAHGAGAGREGRARARGAHADRQARRRRERAEEGEDARVRRRVAEARERRLHDRVRQPLVEAAAAAE